MLSSFCAVDMAHKYHHIILVVWAEAFSLWYHISDELMVSRYGASARKLEDRSKTAVFYAHHPMFVPDP